MTQAAGWKPNEEEYILMGASAVKKHKIESYDIVKELYSTRHRLLQTNFTSFISTSFLD